jgi:predicted ATP-grasp superfamily ATP-dependent carboligase
MTRTVPPTLLAGGDDRSMLAAARSLGSHRVPFVAVGVEPRTMVGSSRALRGSIGGGGPDPGREPEAYADFVLDAARRHGAGLVLPLTDKTVLACDLRRAAFDAEAPLALTASSGIRSVLDKRLNREIALRLGIPCPAQFELERLDQLPELVARIGLPLVLKDPGPAAEGGERPRFDGRFLVVHDERQLAEALSRCPPGGFPLAQRFVTGTVHNVCCFAVEGEIVAAHEFRGIRSLRSSTCCREMTPVSPDLGEYAARMLGELRWDGAAHVGFLVGDDGDVRYMETNGRFWAAVCGSVAAGWDFPYWTYRYFAFGERPKAPPPSRWVGRRSRWHYGELEAMIRYLAGEWHPSWAGRSRARAVADYLAGFRPGVDADVFRLDDPLPELAEHWREGKRYGSGLVRGAARRTRRLGARVARLSEC